MFYLHFQIIILFIFIFFITGSLQSIDLDESFCTTIHDKQKGVCISLNNQLNYCPKLKKYLKSQDKENWEKLRQTFCSETIKNGRVCCPIEGTDSYEDDTTYNLEPNYTDHPNWNLLALKNTRCGITVSANRVIGGKDAYLGQFPWMARIGYLRGNDSQPIFSCSGTIINKRYILTAAHCLLPYKQGYQLAPIRLAENDDSKNPEIVDSISTYYKDYQIESEHIHPNYTFNKISPHDIALIRLKDEIENITTDYFKRAICLPFVKEYNLGDQLSEIKMVRNRNDNTKAFRPLVAGWGKTDNKLNIGSSILQYLDVPVQPSILCRILYANSNFSNKHLCVGGEENKNSCLGDSGGPLIYNAAPSITMGKSKTVLQRKFQIGIVSYGKTECGQKGIPVVYTRIRDYLSWILDTLRE